MATLIDATWGGDEANSFVDLTTANSHFSASLDEAAWTALSTSPGTPTQEKLLIEASARISSLRWRGAKQYLDQALGFPRSIDVQTTFQGLEVLPAAVGSTDLNIYEQRQQENVQAATCTLALWIYQKEVSVTDTHGQLQAAGISSWSDNYPGLGRSFTYDRAARSKLCPGAMRLLRRYRASGVRVVRGDSLDASGDTR